MAREQAWEDEYTLLCERCGYVVEGLDPAGNCPECGKPIAESLPERRVGTPWQRGSSSLGTFAATVRAVLTNPRRTLGIMAFVPYAEPRALARTSHLLSAAAMTLPFVVTLVYLTARVDDDSAGFVCVGIGVCFAVFFGTWLALAGMTWIEIRGLIFIGNRRGFRMTRDIALTVCAHGTAGWVLGSFGFAISIGAIFLLSYPFGWIGNSLIGWAPIVALITGFLFFETFAYLGLRRCKFANRARPVHAGEPEAPPPS